MKAKLRALSLLIVALVTFQACSDDNEGAKYNITIEQKGDFASYKKTMTLIAAGGLYDEINQVNINNPTIDNTHFEKTKLSLSTREKINILITTIKIELAEVDGKVVDLETVGEMTLSIIVTKDGKEVMNKDYVYDNEENYPQSIAITRE